jgi:hypothetical protein
MQQRKASKKKEFGSPNDDEMKIAQGQKAEHESSAA